MSQNPTVVRTLS